MNRKMMGYVRYMLPKDAQSIQSRLAQEVMFKKRRFNNSKIPKRKRGAQKSFFQVEERYNTKLEDFVIPASENHRQTTVIFDHKKHTKEVIITDNEPFVGAKMVDKGVYQRTLEFKLKPQIKQIKHSVH